MSGSSDDEMVPMRLWTGHGYQNPVGCQERVDQSPLQVFVPGGANESDPSLPSHLALVWNDRHFSSGHIGVKFLQNNSVVEKSVSGQSLKEFSGFVLVPKRPTPKQNQIWQPLHDDNGYVWLICAKGSASYLVFRQLDPKSKKVLGRVGLRPLAEVALLNRFKVAPVGEAFGSETEELESDEGNKNKLGFNFAKLVEEALPVKGSEEKRAAAQESKEESKKGIAFSFTKNPEPAKVPKAGPSNSGTAAAASGSGSLSVANGPAHMIVCVNSSNLNVRDDSLGKVLFQIGNHAPAKVFQEWSQEKYRKVISGQTYYFIKVQFPSRPFGSDMGWVAENYIKAKSQCSSFREGVSLVDKGTQEAKSENSGGALGYIFPTRSRPMQSYKSGGRAFGAGRNEGRRQHAGVDICRNLGDEVRAVADGVVIQGPYHFYNNTAAIEVRKADGAILLYGEIMQGRNAGVGPGAIVKKGQTIGFVGDTGGESPPMLHLEMYTGRGQGPLTNRQSGGSFQRRSDLANPTVQVSTWERNTFGTSF